MLALAVTLAACGAIEAPGTYELAADLVAPGTCLEVRAPGVTIEGGGHSITWATERVGAGIDARTADSLVVRDLVLRYGNAPASSGRAEAVYLRDTASARLEDVEFALDVHATGPAVRGVWASYCGGGELVLERLRMHGRGAGVIRWIESDARLELRDSTLEWRPPALRDAWTRPAVVVLGAGAEGSVITGADWRIEPSGQGDQYTGLQAYGCGEGELADSRIVFSARTGVARPVLLDRGSDGWLVQRNTIEHAGAGAAVRVRSSARTSVRANTIDVSGGRAHAVHVGAYQGVEGTRLEANRARCGAGDCYYWEGQSSGSVIDGDELVAGAGRPLRVLESDDEIAGLTLRGVRISGPQAEAVWLDDWAPAGAEGRVEGLRLCGVTVDGRPLRHSDVRDDGAPDGWMADPGGSSPALREDGACLYHPCSDDSLDPPRLGNEWFGWDPSPGADRYEIREHISGALCETITRRCWWSSRRGRTVCRWPRLMASPYRYTGDCWPALGQLYSYTVTACSDETGCGEPAGPVEYVGQPYRCWDDQLEVPCE